jgi:hypothetical protein
LARPISFLDFAEPIARDNADFVAKNGFYAKQKEIFGFYETLAMFQILATLAVVCVAPTTASVMAYLLQLGLGLLRAINRF